MEKKEKKGWERWDVNRCPAEMTCEHVKYLHAVENPSELAEQADALSDLQIITQSTHLENTQNTDNCNKLQPKLPIPENTRNTDNCNTL